MPEIKQLPEIEGVKVVQLRAFADERGRFLEAFRREWFPERNWDAMQMNRSDNKQYVLRGLHYHFQQADYWYALHGTIRVGLFDLRRSSPTWGKGHVFDIGTVNEVGVLIPPGVAHGFVTLTDATLVYVVDQYYNAADEFGVRWDDPALKLQWNVPTPILSERDRFNPLWDEIDETLLPV